jgi:drug/metabolite transporter (DMT)-like permease
MNAIRNSLGTIGAITLGLCWIAATVVAVIFAKITVKVTIWSFVIGVAAALILALLWKLGKLISGRRTTDNGGAMLFVIATIIVLATPAVVSFYYKDFSWPLAYWGLLSGALLVVGYLAYYFGDKYAEHR